MTSSARRTTSKPPLRGHCSAPDAPDYTGWVNFRTALPVLAYSVAASLVVSGCSILPGSAAQSDGNYPQTIDSPFGSAEIPSLPRRSPSSARPISTSPWPSASHPSSPPPQTVPTGSAWAQQAIDDKRLSAPDTFDAGGGPDITAIERAQPDIILATGLEDAGDRFDELSAIAPVVASAPDATWTDRTAAVATALDRADEAKTVVIDVDAHAPDIADSHLEFEDTTYTLADVQKSSIDYLSYDGSDDSFFTGLGLLSAPAAAKYTAAKHTVKKSKVDTLDADVLFIHFPSSGKGLLDESDLSDPFYREVKVIRGKHYTVLDDDEFTALTNLSPLSYPWLLDELPDAIGKAEQGEA